KSPGGNARSSRRCSIDDVATSETVGGSVLTGSDDMRVIEHPTRASSPRSVAAATRELRNEGSSISARCKSAHHLGETRRGGGGALSQEEICHASHHHT